MTGISPFAGVDEIGNNVSEENLTSRGGEARDAFKALEEWFSNFDGVSGTHIDYDVIEGVDRNGDREFTPNKDLPISISVTAMSDNVDADLLNTFIDVAHELNLSIRTYDLEAHEDAVQYIFKPDFS